MFWLHLLQLISNHWHFRCICCNSSPEWPFLRPWRWSQFLQILFSSSCYQLGKNRQTRSGSICKERQHRLWQSYTLGANRWLLGGERAEILSSMRSSCSGLKIGTTFAWGLSLQALAWDVLAHLFQDRSGCSIFHLTPFRHTKILAAARLLFKVCSVMVRPQRSVSLVTWTLASWANITMIKTVVSLTREGNLIYLVWVVVLLELRSRINTNLNVILWYTKYETGIHWNYLVNFIYSFLIWPFRLTVEMPALDEYWGPGNNTIINSQGQFPKTFLKGKLIYLNTHIPWTTLVILVMDGSKSSNPSMVISVKEGFDWITLVTVVILGPEEQVGLHRTTYKRCFY